MTVSHTIVLALIGKTVSFNYEFYGQKFSVTGEVQGIFFDVTGPLEFFVNDRTYSVSEDYIDFKIH